MEEQDRFRALIFDIDGTLANIDHRRHFVTGEKKYWNHFNAACQEDTVNQDVRELLDALYGQYAILLVSGRNEAMRGDTIDWMEYHGIPFHKLYMRADGDYRPDEVVKAEIYEELKKDGYDPFCVFDDRNKVVAMWREKGLLCCQVAEGNF